ncbi:MAG: sensor histidine kinase [Faecousia sp.]
MIRRLKIKFVCINMLIVTIVLAVIFGFVLHNTSRDLETQSYRTIERIQDRQPGKSPMRNDVPDSYFVYFKSETGEVNIVTHGLFEDYTQQELLEISQSIEEKEEERGAWEEQNLRFARKRIPKGEIITVIDTSIQGRIIRGLIKTCVKIYAASFALFLCISVALAQWAVQPVEKAWNTQHQFVADASHELKTPLTVIMTNAEILQEREDDAQLNQFVHNILDMSKQMRGLVEGLLNLARVDNGVVKTTFSEVNFTTLVNNCLLPFEPVFFENGMMMETELEEAVYLKGSETHLRQVVDILLDNALKYGKKENSVIISLRRHGKNALLCVSTAGEAISQQDLKNIFKRFYRIDKARAMNHSYGLGLSIAERIVSDHKGKIWAESKNGRNSFFVQLPCHYFRMEGTPEKNMQRK